MLSKLTIEQLIKAYKNKNYKLYENGNYNVNVFGIRKNENISNRFNDVIGLLYKVRWKLDT